jgi:hypothetical protein
MKVVLFFDALLAVYLISQYIKMAKQVKEYRGK